MIKIKREVFEEMLEGYGAYVECETCICDTQWCRGNMGEHRSCRSAVMAWLKKENAIESDKKTICSDCILTVRCRIYKSGERPETECPIDCYTTELDALFPMYKKQETVRNHD